MRKVLVALVVVALMLVGGEVRPAHGRIGPIVSSLDWIVQTGPGRMVAAGWAFNCQQNGQHPYAVRVWNDGTGQVFALSARVSGVYRPDVAAAFASPCGGAGMNAYTGFGLTIEGLPVGQSPLIIEFSDSVGVGYILQTVTVQ